MLMTRTRRLSPFVLFALFFVMLVVPGTVILRQQATINAQQARIVRAEQHEAVLRASAARWEEIAKRFERLNLDCIELTFGRRQ